MPGWARRNRSTWDGETRSPPIMTSSEPSNAAASSSTIMLKRLVVGKTVCVPWSVTVVRNACGDRKGSGTIAEVPPLSRADHSSNEKPSHDTAAANAVTVFGENLAKVRGSNSRAVARWLDGTSFGAPVVPEVRKTVHIASAPGAAATKLCGGAT